MARVWRTALGLAVAGCTAAAPLSAQQAVPVIPFVPTAAYEWPLWPAPDGALIGGSGYTTGYGGPWGVTPGLGMGAVLLPSMTAAHTVFPGPLPWPPPPLAASFPVWATASEVEAHASDVPSLAVPALVNASAHPSDTSGAPTPLVLTPSPYPVLPVWTKMGQTFVPPPAWTAWPDQPYVWTPWGAVTWQTGPAPKDKPLVDLGFPTADGTPETQAYFLPWIRVIKGTQDLVLWDFVTRSLHKVPSLIPLAGFPFAGVTQRDGVLLVAAPDPSGSLKLIDLLSGGIDVLPEIRDAIPEINGNFSWKGWFIAYTALHEGRQEVHLFDRRTRMIDRLGHLNMAGAHYAPAVDLMARTIACVTDGGGSQDLVVYDTITGLIDPLPAVNTGADEFAPYLSDDGRWLLFIRRVDGMGRILLYDRLTGGLDPLPELNTLGDFATTGLSGDGLIIDASYRRGGRQLGVVYMRPSGFIDPIPEVNDTAEAVFF